MQVLTCAVASFAHGASDVSNAVAPLAAVHYAWKNGQVTPASSGTPIWVLAFGGAMICVGLATYGYNIMSVMGNRLTMHSPSRSVAISLGAAITTLLAAQVGNNLSSIFAIFGATAGVGITSSGWRSLNYKMFGWIILGWVSLRLAPSRGEKGLRLTVADHHPSRLRHSVRRLARPLHQRPSARIEIGRP